MNKILCLNSGGFDSVVMLHYIRENFPEAEIDTLFFRWGQSNCRMEEDCARQSSLKVLNKSPIVMTVPSAEIWSSVKMQTDEQYIPMRNLVFLSMAIAYAQKNGYDTIAMAAIEAFLPTAYSDASDEFLDNMAYITKMCNIGIYTPFANMYRDDLFPYAKKYGISERDFFSCNTPVVNANGSLTACGKCADCKMLNLYKSVDLP